MALSVKQFVAMGLVLGILSALGYRFLTDKSPKAALKKERLQLQSINSFELEPVELGGAIGSPVSDTATASKTSFQLDHSEVVETSVPKADALTDFQMKRVVGRADSLQLENEMEQPHGNGHSDSFDLSELELSSPSTSNLATTEPVLELESPRAPVENQDRPIENSPVAPLSLESKVERSTQIVKPADRELPMVGTLDRNVDAPTQSPDKPKGWNANPFFNNDPNSVRNPIEREDTSSLWRSKPSHNQGELSLVAGATNLSSRTGSADPYMTSQTVPSNSVLSLNDPSRNRATNRSETSVLEIRGEPERDFSMLGETRAISLSEADLLQAVHHIEYGKSLSRRGAGFSAREEFLRALQVLAEANDRASRSNVHTSALRDAALIMREAEDFSNGSAEQLIQMDIAKVIDSHRSGILTQEEARNMTASNAIDRYFSVAQEKLDLAGGRNVVSSEAFFCLGKLQSVLPNNQAVSNSLDIAKSVVYHQAALMGDPKHHRSANELGVLFARSGRLQQAKQLFEHSLLAQPHPQTWQNLATTHRRLGEHDFARRAENERVLLAQQGAVVTQVNWQPVEVFNAETDIPVGERMATRPTAIPSQVDSGESTAGPKSLADRLKNLF